MAARLPEPFALSIIVPVLNEATRLDACLSRLMTLGDDGAKVETIVVDGGSRDGSQQIAAKYPCRLLNSSAGRAAQMNAGAARACGDTLLFLHADSHLPEPAGLARLARTDWGFFRVALGGRGADLRLIERAINLRTGATRIAGGDQGLFFKREFFDLLGGFPPIPLMEDIAICKLARRRAAPRIIGSPMTTSSRRWRERGVLRTVVLMWWLRFAYWLGVDPGRLHRLYYSR